MTNIIKLNFKLIRIFQIIKIHTYYIYIVEEGRIPYFFNVHIYTNKHLYFNKKAKHYNYAKIKDIHISNIYVILNKKKKKLKYIYKYNNK